MHEATVLDMAPAIINSRKSLEDLQGLQVLTSELSSPTRAAISLALIASYMTKCTTVSDIPKYEAVIPL